MMPPLPEGTSRLYRSTEGRLLGGVSRGLARHLGVDAWMVRLAFLFMVPIDGAGFVAYAAFWMLVPLGRTQPVARSVPRPGVRRALVVVLVAEAVTVIGFNASHSHGRWSVILPAAAVVVGLSVLWRQADDAQRSRWMAPYRGRRTGALVQAILGALVVLGGIVVLISGGVPWSKSGAILLAAAALAGGVVLIAMPFLMRTFRDLSAERAARIRSQERAEVAALMHDSVLHTLTLIQRNSADGVEVARLARAQERELRAWLYEGGPRPGSAGPEPETFGQAIKAAIAEVEDRHSVQIEVVTVGEAPLDDRLTACIAAAREAAVNAAKYAKGAPISVYAEVETQGDRTVGAEVFVRDRGPGFDLDTVAEDRMGIRESIIGRMKRFGGKADIRTAPGEGTEVRIGWRRD